MKLAYIAGPFRAKDKTHGYNYYEQQKNIEAARDAGLRICQVMRGEWYCFIPHMNTSHFQGAMPDQFWLDGDLEALRRCDALVLLSTWWRSVGSRMEKQCAQKLNKPTMVYDPTMSDGAIRLGFKAIEYRLGRQQWWLKRFWRKVAS